MNKRDLSAYMSKIGKIGGKKSRRVLTAEQARAMAELSIESKRSRKAGSAPKRKRFLVREQRNPRKPAEQYGKLGSKLGTSTK